jgi:hypothetical protein
MAWRDLVPIALGVASLPVLLLAAKEMDAVVARRGKPNHVVVHAPARPAAESGPSPLQRSLDEARARAPRPPMAGPKLPARPNVAPPVDPGPAPGPRRSPGPMFAGRGPQAGPRFPTPPSSPGRDAVARLQPPAGFAPPAPPAPPEGTSVTIEAENLDGPTIQAVNARLSDLLKSRGGAWSLRSRSDGPRCRFTVSPVDDVREFADRLTFASQVRVEGRTIRVDVDPSRLSAGEK